MEVGLCMPPAGLAPTNSTPRSMKRPRRWSRTSADLRSAAMRNRLPHGLSEMRQPTEYATRDPEGVRLSQSSFHVYVNLDGPRVVALARLGAPRTGAPAVRTACVWRASSCRGGTQAATAML